MKKIVAVLLLSVVCCSCAGCGNPVPSGSVLSPASPTSSMPESSENETSSVAVVDGTEGEDVEYVLNEITFICSKRYDVSETDTGYEVTFEDGKSVLAINSESEFFTVIKELGDGDPALFGSLYVGSLLQDAETQNLDEGDVNIAGISAYMATCLLKVSGNWVNTAIATIPGNEYGYVFIFMDSGSDAGQAYPSEFQRILESVRLA